MESSLGWIDLSPAALRRLRQELDPETEGVVDEMGVGAIHAGYADHFFPGTSVLHRRPRYVFFTCWNYLSIDTDDGDAVQAKEDAELWVRNQLLKSGQLGVIGKLVEHPAQPVDFIYWTALRKWGFYQGPNRSTLLSRPGEFSIRRVRPERNDDEEVIDDSQASFLVPKPPPYWLRPKPREAVTFELTWGEADFLQKRLESLPACLLSSAASIARKRLSTGKAPWEDAVIKKGAREVGESDMLQRAQLASSFALLIRSIYAALVEQRRNDTAAPAVLSRVPEKHYYRYILRALFERDEQVAVDVRRLDLALLKQDLPQLSDTLLKLLSDVQERVGKGIRVADIDKQLLGEDIMDRFSNEEACRKDRRARLPDTAFGLERRESFDEMTVRVTGIDYRWRVVKALLRDLHIGLERRVK
jgi:hypothetical protein